SGIDEDRRDFAAIGDRARACAAVIALLLDREALAAEARQLRRSLREARRDLRRLAEIGTREKDLRDTARMTDRARLVDEARRRDGIEAVRVIVPVAASRAMRSILARVPALSDGNHPVLILGESGVGKDVLARYIHACGPRRDRP